MPQHSVEHGRRTGELLRRGAIAGVSAGVIFALTQMLVAEFQGGGSSEPWRLVASILLGAGVLLAPFTLTVGLLAVGLHLLLSALFGTIWGAVAAVRDGIRHGQGRHVVAAMVFGGLLYLVNIELIARFAFPWFLEVNRPVQLLLHALAFGLPLGVYLFVQVHPPETGRRVRRVRRTHRAAA